MAVIALGIWRNRLLAGLTVAVAVGAAAIATSLPRPHHARSGTCHDRIDSLVRLRNEPGDLGEGIRLLLVGKSAAAVAPLQRAATANPRSAASWNALAVARLDRALSNDDAEELVNALEAADHAAQNDSISAEVSFNRGLMLESLGLRPAAARAYRRAITLEAEDSPWLAVDQDRFIRCARSWAAARWTADRVRLVDAARKDDQETVNHLVDRYPQEARTWSEGVDLSEWADRVQKGQDGAEALKRARLVGRALQRRSSEQLLADSVAAIDRAVASNVQPRIFLLAKGHTVYRRARMLYGGEERHVADALTLFREAAALFRAGGSPMALLADYYRASAQFELNQRGPP